MTYAFIFDASACSGCKACQAACKDRNNLPLGVLWRRVIEVSGGVWTQNGNAWENTVFAYNLSIACNHCVHPKCAGVCPTNAYHVREDGIVLLDSSKCVGCGYCNWACPYAVPQYNIASGLMTKCNFCCDAIDAGESPACVAACPMRVLDFAAGVDQEHVSSLSPGISLWEVPGSEHPFPLPAYSRTQPHIRINPHPAMSNKLEKVVANHEEIKSQNAKSELPLVVFTLLGQMAVGAFWALQWMFAPISNLDEPKPIFLRLFPALLIGISLGLGMLVSFAHLGAKRNAWRVFNNLHKSWLSREILMVGLFGLGWLLSLFIQTTVSSLLTSLLGFGLIYSMANVYQLRSMAVWNNGRTLVGFLFSAFLLGQFLLVPVLLYETQSTGIKLPSVYLGWINCFSVALLMGELVLMFLARCASCIRHFGKSSWLRVGLIFLIILGLGGENIRLLSTDAFPIPASQPEWVWPYVIFLLLLFVEESLGRWLFYAELDQRTL